MIMMDTQRLRNSRSSDLPNYFDWRLFEQELLNMALVHGVMIIAALWNLSCKEHFTEID